MLGLVQNVDSAYPEQLVETVGHRSKGEVADVHSSHAWPAGSHDTGPAATMSSRQRICRIPLFWSRMAPRRAVSAAGGVVRPPHRSPGYDACSSRRSGLWRLDKLGVELIVVEDHEPALKCDDPLMVVNLDRWDAAGNVVDLEMPPNVREARAAPDVDKVEHGLLIDRMLVSNCLQWLPELVRTHCLDGSQRSSRLGSLQPCEYGAGMMRGAMHPAGSYVLPDPKPVLPPTLEATRRRSRRIRRDLWHDGSDG